MNTEQPTMYMLVGLPASGKSTWVKENIASDVVVVSSDKYIEEYAELAGKTYTEVFKDIVNQANVNAYRDFALAVQKGRSFVIDRTNMTAKGRKSFLKKVSKSGHRKVAVVFEVSEDTRRDRDQKRVEITGKYIPESVINSMKESYSKPTYDEGFDEIITVKE